MVRSMYGRFFVGLEGHGPAVVEPNAIVRGAWATIAGQGPAAWLVLALALVGIVVTARERDPRARTFVVWLTVASIVLFVTKTFLPQYALVVLLPLCAVAGVGAGKALELARGWGPLIAATIALALCAPLVEVDALAHHADDDVAQLTRRQAAAPVDALVCTVDLYHAASAFEGDRLVLYLTEDERSRRILRRTFGEPTVPTLNVGDIATRLDRAPHVACLMTRDRLAMLASQLHGSYGMEPLEGALVLLVR
jgi:hypothetical protein